MTTDQSGRVLSPLAQRVGCYRTPDVRLTVGRGDRVRVRNYCEPCMAEWRTIFARSTPPVTYREEAVTHA